LTVEAEGRGGKPRLLYVRFRDHLRFQNADPKLYREPPVMHGVGWLDYENEHCMILVSEWHRPVPYERRRDRSGLLILKRDVVEVRELEW
jgi:hypothetical protein